ncbi:MAG: diacylglycerol/lipid kinase family protein [Pannonibacter phragmitetus]
MRVTALLNRDGGTLKTADIQAVCNRIEAEFSAAGHEVQCIVTSSACLEDNLNRIAGDPATEVILAGGGDGTISAAAATAYRSGKVLGVLPAGTMNLFARSLAIPLPLDKAIAALAKAEVVRSDIGLMNGRPFVHQFSLGLQAQMIRERDKAEHASRLAKMWGSFRAFLRSTFRPFSFRARLRTGNEVRRGRFSIIAVSNNVYGEGTLPYAARLDEGVLGVYSVHRLTSLETTLLAADLARGAWRSNANLMYDRAREVEVELSPSMRRKIGVLDGELIDLPLKITVKIEPQALAVLRPAAAGAA